VGIGRRCGLAGLKKIIKAITAGMSAATAVIMPGSVVQKIFLIWTDSR